MCRFLLISNLLLLTLSCAVLLLTPSPPPTPYFSQSTKVLFIENIDVWCVPPLRRTRHLMDCVLLRRNRSQLNYMCIGETANGNDKKRKWNKIKGRNLLVFTWEHLHSAQYIHLYVFSCSMPLASALLKIHFIRTCEVAFVSTTRQTNAKCTTIKLPSIGIRNHTFYYWIIRFRIIAQRIRRR